MTTLLQKMFPGKRSEFTIIDDRLLRISTRTISTTTNYVVELAELNPNPVHVRNTATGLIITFVAMVAIVVVSWTVAELSKSEAMAIIAAMISMFGGLIGICLPLAIIGRRHNSYYFESNVTRTAMVWFWTDKPDPKRFQEFIEAMSISIRIAQGTLSRSGIGFHSGNEHAEKNNERT